MGKYDKRTDCKYKIEHIKPGEERTGVWTCCLETLYQIRDAIKYHLPFV